MPESEFPNVCWMWLWLVFFGQWWLHTNGSSEHTLKVTCPTLKADKLTLMKSAVVRLSQTFSNVVIVMNCFVPVILLRFPNLWLDRFVQHEGTHFLFRFDKIYFDLSCLGNCTFWSAMSEKPIFCYDSAVEFLFCIKHYSVRSLSFVVTSNFLLCWQLRL